MGHLLRDKGLAGMWAAASNKVRAELGKEEAVSTARRFGSPRGELPPLPATHLAALTS